jgi:hypothetical protein
MNYKERVDKLVGLLLRCEELEQNCEVILDSELAYDVAKELYYKLDKYFLIEEQDQFEKDLKENDILGVALLIHSDGMVEYFLQPVMNDEGDTYEDQLTDVLYIQDDLIDCVDINEFKIADKFIISEDEIDNIYCDCKYCQDCDEEYLEFEEEMNNYIDETIDDIHGYFIEKLIGNENNIDLFDLIDEVLRIAFMEGFGKALE